MGVPVKERWTRWCKNYIKSYFFVKKFWLRSECARGWWILSRYCNYCWDADVWISKVGHRGRGGGDKVHPPLLVRNGAWAFGCSGGGFGIFGYIMAQFISDTCAESRQEAADAVRAALSLMLGSHSGGRVTGAERASHWSCPQHTTSFSQ